MATKRISELTAITAVTTDDNLIINDGNTATRRITFGNFMNSVAGENTTFSGNVTFGGTTSGISLDELTDVDLTTSAPTDGQILQYDATGAKFVPVGLSSGAFANLAAFAGALNGDVNFSATINTRLETLTGAAAAASNLGTFSGSTITDGRTIKEALQDLETTLEAIDIDTDDLAALTGISENVTNLGSFTGSIISDNTAVKTALQELETSVELKATTATPTFTGHVLSPEFRAAGTGHLKLRAETGNDLNIYLADAETLQITRDPSTGNPKFTAVGGTGECQFLQSVDLVSGFKVGGVAVSATAAELNYVDGVTSNVQTQLDAKALASAVTNVDNTSDADKPISTATQTALDLKATLAAPTFTGDVTIGAGAFYKSSNERMGLGTTAPNGRLHVKTSGGVAARFERETGSSALVVKNNTSDDGMTVQGSSNSINSIRFEGYGNNIGFRFVENDGGTVTDLMHVKSSGIDFDKDVTFKPSASVTPAANGELMVEATSNTTLTFKLKGDDGVVRSGTITLS